jgi:hypothetical protein
MGDPGVALRAVRAQTRRSAARVTVVVVCTTSYRRLHHAEAGTGVVASGADIRRGGRQQRLPGAVERSVQVLLRLARRLLQRAIGGILVGIRPVQILKVLDR